MRRTKILFLALGWLLTAAPVAAQQKVEDILPLDGRIADDGSSIDLSWFDADPPRVGSVTVNRRLYGQTGGDSWKPLAEGLGPVMRYVDDTIKPGVAYEYQVLRSARDIVDVGYWVAGTDLPVQPRRGHAYVVVDDTIMEALDPYLQRFIRDLVGEGWQVHFTPVPRGKSDAPVENLKVALVLKNWLTERYQQDPFGQHAVILIGHVPLVRSGKVNPDGHDQVPHGTDLFYADMDGRWTATKEGVLLDQRVPGNFIELQVGRIDFRAASDDTATETRLLRAYFDKNHHWRTGRLGDLREAYGQSYHLTAEKFALRNIVGPEAVTEGGHHDVGEEKPWLWGVDFGDWDARQYAEKYANKAVFAINFGSGKQKIGQKFNGMAALLAQPWYPVAVGWGARPTWWLHHMALGGSIGDVHLRTVNNGMANKPYRETMDYFPTGAYLWRNPIWVNLLGDPTLRAFVLAPATELQAAPVDQGVALSWTASADPDVLGYRVYRAPEGSLDFIRISDTAPVTGTAFLDSAPTPNARYMVRAYGLKRVHAGSFHTLSPGSFADIGQPPLAPQTLALTTPAEQALDLPEPFNGAENGVLHAFIEGPPVGSLTQEDGRWRYSPPEGFSGEVPIRFSVTTALQSAEGLLTVTVTP